MTDIIEQIEQDVVIIGDRNIVTGTGNVSITYTISPAEEKARKDLAKLLFNVETTWIKGVLQKSIYAAVLLDLGMESRTDVVAHPWRMELEGSDQVREVIPPEKPIKVVFNDANHLLLILGEPGSGKTTTLLQLARDLIAEVDEAFTHPVPVIFNLITWTNQQQPIEEWLIAEMNSPKYRLPPQDGRRYLEERRILPLLDGLDEVKAEKRSACVEQINRFVSSYGLQGMVVCSRIKDYTALDARLTFHGAIYLQPLTPQQIDQYFDRFSVQLASLRTTLRRDEALQSLAQSPLILNIMSLAYQNTSAEALGDPALDTDEARRQHLFDAYITRMFKRRRDRWPYDDGQTKQRLSWLAQNMQRHNQEIFQIEGLQPSWLQTRRWRWIYTAASRLVIGSIVGLLLALISLIIFDTILITESGQQFLSGPLLGLVFGLSVGVSSALIDGIRFNILQFAWLRRRVENSASPPFWWSIAKAVVVWVSIGLILRLCLETITGLSSKSPIGLSPGLLGGLSLVLVFVLLGGWSVALGAGIPFGLIGGLRSSVLRIVRLVEWLGRQNERKKSPPIWWSITNIVVIWLCFEVMLAFVRRLTVIDIETITGLIAGLFAGLILGLRGSQQNWENDIQTVEALRWSWLGVLRGGLFGALLGMLSGVIIALIGEYESTGGGLDAFGMLVLMANLAYIFGLIGGLIGGFFGGLSGQIIETKTVPNQGIRLSVRYATTIGLTAGLIFGLFFELSGQWDPFGAVELLSLNGGLSHKWIGGVIVGLFGVILYGGFDIIQHYTLRLALIAQGHTPGNYARFLDHAADRIFLQKVGGGYRFIHRLLLEHFAALHEKEEKLPATTKAATDRFDTRKRNVM